MAQDASNVPVETGESPVLAKKEESPQELTNSRFFLEAAGLLALWSVLVINEGAIRLIASNPAAGLSRDGRPPPVVLFLGGLFEVIFGLIGLFVGVAGFIFRWYSTNATKLAIAVQTLFGYYVFAVYVFVQPALTASDLEAPALEGLTIGESKFLIALGVLTSFHFCLALQGGQFVFFVRLICGGTGRNFLMQRTGNTMRAIFWNMNLALSGIWTLITGGLINASVGGGKLDAPFAFPPNVGRMPGLTISTGIVMILYGLAGASMAGMKMRVPGWYYFVGGYVYLTAFANFTIVQFGLIEGASGGPVALHAGLVFMTVFIGPYFVRLAQMESAEKKP